MKKETKKPPQLPMKKPTASQRYADGLATIMGSWWFLIGFSVFILAWIVINAIAWGQQWDPYPFILLNLTLSCVSAIQAPIILMSQNRQAERDRQTAHYDYIVDRQTEREVRDMQKDLEEIKEMIRGLKK
jgi:uncharacterized membrane protein